MVLPHFLQGTARHMVELLRFEGGTARVKVVGVVRTPAGTRRASGPVAATLGYAWGYVAALEG
ncbi:hypothetical protein ASH02_01770 [Nocardioides sp. Soil796]|nr:hypothetical protein ASH02_01770 [Nocardioides sp. Soil796]